jgi:hypothetical protein
MARPPGSAGHLIIAPTLGEYGETPCASRESSPSNDGGFLHDAHPVITIREIDGKSRNTWNPLRENRLLKNFRTRVDVEPTMFDRAMKGDPAMAVKKRATRKKKAAPKRKSGTKRKVSKKRVAKKNAPARKKGAAKKRAARKPAAKRKTAKKKAASKRKTATQSKARRKK